MGQYSPQIVEQVSGLLEIGISLSGEKKRKRLLEKILAKALKVTNADAGTLFLRAEDKLIFENLQQKKSQYKEKLKESLSGEERELYDFLEPEPEILMSEDLPEDIDEQDLENFFDEIFNTLDELDHGEEEEKNVADSQQKKVIDMEQYRKK